VILKDETGGYIAIVTVLHGCPIQGDTFVEVMENANELIDL
jgi:predicted RNase H-like HicB family nuclease